MINNTNQTNYYFLKMFDNYEQLILNLVFTYILCVSVESNMCIGRILSTENI